MAKRKFLEVHKSKKFEKRGFLWAVWVKGANDTLVERPVTNFDWPDNTTLTHADIFKFLLPDPDESLGKTVCYKDKYEVDIPFLPILPKKNLTFFEKMDTLVSGASLTMPLLMIGTLASVLVGALIFTAAVLFNSAIDIPSSMFGFVNNIFNAITNTDGNGRMNRLKSAGDCVLNMVTLGVYLQIKTDSEYLTKEKNNQVYFGYREKASFQVSTLKGTIFVLERFAEAFEHEARKMGRVFQSPVQEVASRKGPTVVWFSRSRLIWCTIGFYFL